MNVPVVPPSSNEISRWKLGWNHRSVRVRQSCEYFFSLWISLKREENWIGDFFMRYPCMPLFHFVWWSHWWGARGWRHFTRESIKMWTCEPEMTQAHKLYEHVYYSGLRHPCVLFPCSFDWRRRRCTHEDDLSLDLRFELWKGLRLSNHQIGTFIAWR